jgi:uncharacterized protein (DUF1499 family)
MTKIRDVMVRLGVALALILPLYFVVAAFGTRFGLFDWRVGFGMMTYRLGNQVIYATLGIGAVALVLSLLTVPRRGMGAALIAVLVPALAIGYGNYNRSQSAGVLPIHDVSTDAIDPPAFGPQVMAIRSAENANPVVPPALPMRERAYFQRMVVVMPERAAAMADKSVADIVAAAYPDIRPIELAIPTGQAFALAKLEAEARGWTVHAADAGRGALDATAETFWFGFKDDVAVRVRTGSAPDTAIVDVRSISRVGGGDMGANARRIRDFRDGLQRRAG